MTALMPIFGCSTAPPREVMPYLTEYGATSVRVFSLFGRYHVRFGSYLPGEKRSGVNKRAIAEFEDARGRVRFVGLDPAALIEGAAYDASTLADLGEWILAVPDALREYVPHSLRHIDIEIALIPEGHGYRLLHRTTSDGTTIRARFAFRASGDQEISKRHALRTIAHELFHMLFYIERADSSATATGVDAESEENAAHALEVCVELRVIGATTQDLWRSWGFDTDSGDSRRSAVASLLAPSRLDALWGDLFADDGTVTRDDPAAEKLHAICADLVARLLTHGG